MNVADITLSFTHFYYADRVLNDGLAMVYDHMKARHGRTADMKTITYYSRLRKLASCEDDWKANTGYRFCGVKCRVSPGVIYSNLQEVLPLCTTSVSAVSLHISVYHR